MSIKNPTTIFPKVSHEVTTGGLVMSLDNAFGILFGGDNVMAKQKEQNGTLGRPNSRHRRRAGDLIHDTLLNVGPEDGPSATATASDHPENVMTIQEAEIKISMGIIEHLEGLTLDELIQVLQLILTLEAARGKGKVPDLADLDMEG